MADSDDSQQHPQALEKLRLAQEMLRGFNHRNKNQHRTSKWWARFDMLRRHTNKLVDQLEEQARERRATGKRDKSATAATDSGPVGPVPLRALWLRTECVPQAYL